MGKVTVELDWDAVDSIVKQEMLSHRENLKEDLKKRKAGEGMAIFEVNKKKDIAIIKDHIDAFDTILSYYGVKHE